MTTTGNRNENPSLRDDLPCYHSHRHGKRIPSFHQRRAAGGAGIRPLGKQLCAGGGCGATVDADVPLATTFNTNIAAVRTQQGIAQVNHPNYRWSVTSTDLADMPDGTLLEIWNGQGNIHNLGGVTPSGEKRLSVEQIWDSLLSRGRRVWGVAADDSHFFNPPRVSEPRGAAPGQAWIMVRAGELTADAIKAAIAAGKFYSSTGVVLSDVRATNREIRITIDASKGVTYLTRFIGENGRTLAQSTETSPHYLLHGNEGYVRAAVTDSLGKRAWTQPVFNPGLRRD